MKCARFSCSAAIGIILASAVVGCDPIGQYDLIVENATIWTGDETRPVATTLVVGDGRFLFVGSKSELQGIIGQQDERKGIWGQQIGANTQRIDAQGARILPGLIDAHLHLVSGGLQLSRLNLRDVPDRAAFIAAVAERAKKTPKGGWILGGRWSTESWPDPAQPTKEWIDAVTPDHPVLLSRMDGHGALANSVALKLVGIDKIGPPDPPGGQIDRDPTTNEPTGIFKDAAIDLVDKHIPSLSVREQDEALTAAIKEAHRHGLTGVHTMSSCLDIEAVRRARDQNRLPLRVRAFVQEDNWYAYLDRAKKFPNEDMLRLCGFKEYADGSLGSRTAYMAAPYSDNPPKKKDWRGLPRSTLYCPVPIVDPGGPPRVGTCARLTQICSTLIKHSLSCAVHAIGDEANRVVLDVYEAALDNTRGQCSISGSVLFDQGQYRLLVARLRIEHAQHLLPADIPRFARLGVVASMQPLHKADDARYAEKAIGPERCKTSYAFRSLLDAGAHIAFGSDWPVVSLNPFLGIHAAVTGESLDGKVFVPEQNITVEEALRCYTSGAAYAAGDDDRLGKIKGGYLADFVILDRDVLQIPTTELKSVGVKTTYVGGKMVWTAP